jgi:hypothetical protein
MRRMMAGGGTRPWKDIPGLRTKDFTFIEKTGHGFGFYVFTNKANLSTYMKSPTFAMMG